MKFRRIIVSVISVFVLNSCAVMNEGLYNMQPDGMFQLTLPGMYWCNNNKDILVSKLNKSGYHFVKKTEKETYYQVDPGNIRTCKTGSEIYSNKEKRKSIILLNDWRVSRAFVSPIDWCAFNLYKDYVEK